MSKNSQNKKKGFLSKIGAFFEAITEILGECFDGFDADFD